MQHNSPVYTYVVDDLGEITITIPFEDEQEVLQVKVGDPKWTPGSIVQVDEEMMDYIIGGLLDYTQTGEAPTIGSDKTRL